nr:MAG TPA: hypothetical protein [Caudoviricetes sp.]DAJ46986.1 MAG TPA: hypothetical protein [Caudoviricetes sp.]
MQNICNLLLLINYHIDNIHPSKQTTRRKPP